MDEEKQLAEMQNAMQETLTAYGELVNDFGQCVEGFLLHPESQFWRRMTVHALFASVETATLCVKQILLFFHTMKSIELSNAEIAMLREKVYKLKSNGEAVVDEARLGTLDNLKFTFRLFYKATGTGGHFDTGGSGFSAYQKALAIRDKVTHPKTREGIYVSNDQLHLLRAAMTFIQENLDEVVFISQSLSKKYQL